MLCESSLSKYTMKKILIAIDAEKPDHQGLALGIYLARLTGSGLTGIFLENLPFEYAPDPKFDYGSIYAENIGPGDGPETSFKEKACDASIHEFKSASHAQGITCRIHKDQDVPRDELIAESRYADLIIAAPSLFASSELEIPAGLVKNLMADSECPVMIAPRRMNSISKILFACDGSASALFAIKQFTYLFPELSDADLIVIEANEDAAFSEEQKEKVYEYLKEHYSRISFKDLHGKPKDELFDYSLREADACLVMGAYGRNRLSTLIKESTADLVIKLNNLPVFVTH